MKRFLLPLLAVLLWCLPAHATITAGDFTHDFTASGSTNIASSTAANHNVGNALFVFCGASGIPVSATISSVTNTAGDTFVSTANARRAGAVSTRSEIWYTLSTTGNASDVVNCNWSGNVSFPVIVTMEFAHTNSLVLDVAASSTVEVSGTSFPVQSFSTAAAGIVAIEPMGEGYTTGIGFCFTGGSSSTDNTNAATGVFGTVLYK